jgi:hypothetical protein
MFGIKEKYRQLGLPMLAFHHIYEVVRKKGKYHYLEMGWTLEDNESINSLIEEAGAKIQEISHIQKVFIISKMERIGVEGGLDIVAEHRVPSSLSSGGLRRSSPGDSNGSSNREQSHLRFFHDGGGSAAFFLTKG